MKKIETLEDLNKEINLHPEKKDCILSVSDNKSEICIQRVIVKHPVDFIRNLPDFAKTIHIPVSDIDLSCIGYIGENDNIISLGEQSFYISPFVYFKRPEDVETSVSSDSN